MSQTSWNEYRPGRSFPGVIGRTTDESTPAWPRPVRAVPGSPNVVIIVLDDTGYGQLGCYGSPIATPNLDALASGGLLYSNMHTTALCSPSRSCVVTGRNHHANGMASITELTEDLADRAMSFIADAKQVAPDKPFHLHFCPGATHAPHHVPKEWADRYQGEFDDGWDAYRTVAFDRQKQLGIVPPDARLSPRDPDVPAWESLSPDARRLSARMMEVFAGFLSHTDHHIGRLIDFLKEIGEFDNTLIMVVSDNGASAEGGVSGTTNELQFFNNAPEPLDESLARIDEIGGPETFNHYPWGWTWAGNTPFRRWKRETYRGGVSDPFLVHWPQGFKARGEVRSQFAHIIDMVPTVLDVVGIEPPANIRGVTQSPLHGVSFAHTFDDAEAPTRHRTQYYEMFGHRAIDHDGWRAVCPWPGPSFAEAGRPFGAPIKMTDLDDLDAHHWELYHVEEDVAETRNVAEQHRSKLIEMIALWYVEAGKYNVLPIDSSVLERMMTERPQITQDRTSHTFRPGTQMMPAAVAPRVLNRPHSITADVEIPSGGAEGVLLCQGTNAGGWSFYVKDNHLHYAHNYVQRTLHHVASDETVPEGRHTLRFEFEPTGEPDIAHGKGSPGRAQLYVDDRLVGDVEMPFTTPVAFNPGGMTCGANPGSAITADYRAPFRFTGTLHSVTVDMSGDLILDAPSEMRMHMARQ
ncbi:arylsulfatase [Streptomyces sp. Qhu_M48]|uniref:arylsulfatase n=1 Tax=Streptomyces sp. Qhu_M48 TaxID=3435889 RepID=UPI003F509B5A